MKIKIFALSLCLLASLGQASAQSDYKCGSTNRNEFRFGYSDGLTLGIASFWGMGLSDALTGTQRTDEQSSGVFGMGYRYHICRFRMGLDLGFASVSSKLNYTSGKGVEPTKDVKETQLNFLVMPVAEMVYFKRGIIELYGSVAAGVDFTRVKEKGLTELGKTKAQAKAQTSTDFAFQVNPIALRVGNDRVGGFIEAGLGYKGFLTAGVSLKF